MASWRLGGSVPAFSLAEMMIALAILALGLLVIGAALPVGLRYTRESVNIATGQAAAEHALDLIEQNVCLPQEIDPNNTGAPTREPGLFQPRFAASGDFDPSYEPVIKVRALYMQNVNATPGSGSYGYEDNDGTAFGWTGVLVEDAIRTSLYIADDPKECDNSLGNHWLRWALPSTALVYPPLTPDTPFLQADFFADKYQRRPVLDLNPVDGIGSETRKVLDSLISWTAFYRRVSYDDPATLTINEGDPTLYEFIAVAVRRPSLRHRFPVQHPSDGGQSFVSQRLGVDSAIPIPWLVSFTDPLPWPPGNLNAAFFPLDANGNPMATTGQAPATLAFYCTQGPNGTSGLFPVGSIFIPARNDVHPSTALLGAGDYVSFAPPAPTTLPIYEVVQRPNDTTVVVKYNGYYPQQNGNPPMTAGQWPVWVIPPAYEEGTSFDPVLPDRSPIVAVARRYVRLREIP